MEAILAVKFFSNSLGTEPVRDWLNHGSAAWLHQEATSDS